MERHALREDRVELAADPLDEQVAPLRLADGVPPQDTLNRRPAALVQRVDDLLVVHRVDPLRHGLDHLADRVGLRRRRVDRVLRAPVGREILLDEGGVAR